MSVTTFLRSVMGLHWCRRLSEGNELTPTVAKEKTSQINSGEEIHRSSLSRFALNLKRFLVIAAAIAAVYLAVGSFMFPEWFFALLWRARFWDWDFWMTGISYWLDLHTGVLALALILAFVITLVSYALRNFFLPFVDRFSLRLMSGFFVAILVVALLDYKYAQSSYESWQLIEEALTSFKSTMQLLLDADKPPTIEAPIDFQYLDRTRVEALYNQLEPELVETQRTVSRNESLSGKASVAVGTASTEVGGTKQKGATSSFERAHFSPERKCVELIRYVLQQKTAHYYTDGSGWFFRRILKQGSEDYKKAERESESKKFAEITKADLDKLRISESFSKQVTEESERRMKQYNEEFENELNSLTGLVLIDSIFDVHRGTHNNLILVETFSEKPIHILFRVFAPETVELRPVVAKPKLRLHVFGTVIQPISKDGVIEIRSIALY